MFEVDTRRFGRLLFFTFIVLSGGYGCDDEKEHEPYGVLEPCVVDLDGFLEAGEYQCLPTFDEIVDAGKKCSGVAGGWGYFVARRCENGFEARMDGGPHGYQCFYDLESRILIGARIYTDIPDFCGNTADTIVAGIDIDCPEKAETVLSVDCYDFDAGIDSGPTDTGVSPGTVDAGRLDGSNGNVDRLDSGSEDDSGSL